MPSIFVKAPAPGNDISNMEVIFPAPDFVSIDIAESVGGAAVGTIDNERAFASLPQTDYAALRAAMEESKDQHSDVSGVKEIGISFDSNSGLLSQVRWFHGSGSVMVNFS